MVHISSGTLRGVTDSGVTSFKGIPYAAPPVGEYRWRPPQPVKLWKGERDASKFCSDGAQVGFPRGADSISKTSSEDCLFLNLWLPTGIPKNARLPVMVWIHGGAFLFGSGSQPDFSGEQFAKQGVILITFNYRLGRLGFFAFPALSKEHPEEPKGDYAYMDQIAALKWVQQNIAAFGGDPNGPGLPKWPVYSPRTNEILEFKADGSAVGEPDPKKARLDLIEKAVTSGNLH